MLKPIRCSTSLINQTSVIDITKHDFEKVFGGLWLAMVVFLNSVNTNHCLSQ